MSREPSSSPGAVSPGGGPAELENLSEEECWRLLATQSVGRLGVIRGGYPLIFPVNYALHGGRVVVHTEAGTKLYASRFRRVSFEVDRIDSSKRMGWSVLIRGFALEASSGEDPLYDEVSALRIEPWAPGDRRRVLLIAPISVTGRRITRPADSTSRRASSALTASPNTSTLGPIA